MAGRPRGVPFLVFAAGGLGFVGITLAVALGWLLPADQAALAAVDARRDCAAIALAAGLSLIGAGEVSLLMTALLAIACLLRRQPRAAASLLLLYLSLPIELGLKLTLAQPLPGALYPIPGACEWYHPTLSVATPHSYPSGYAIRVTYFCCLAVAWVFQVSASRPRGPGPHVWGALNAALLGVTLVVLVGSRLLLSWHWPSDLVGGALLGLSLAGLTLLVANGARGLGPPGAIGPPSPPILGGVRG